MSVLVRRVRVNRLRLPHDAIKATARVDYVNRDVVRAMPNGEGAEVDVVLFKLGRWVSDDALEGEYKRRALRAADPYSVAAVNELDPAFADTHPNATHWKDAEGYWCFLTFSRWDDKRLVQARRNEHEWDDDWWFAGLADDRAEQNPASQTTGLC